MSHIKDILQFLNIELHLRCFKI